jgi:serine/threonine protein kinase
MTSHQNTITDSTQSLPTQPPTPPNNKLTKSDVHKRRTYTQPNDAKPSLNDFEVISLLGEGSYAKVVKVKHKATQKIFALKVIEKSHIIKVSRLNRKKKSTRPSSKKMRFSVSITTASSNYTISSLYIPY